MTKNKTRLFTVLGIVTLLVVGSVLSYVILNATDEPNDEDDSARTNTIVKITEKEYSSEKGASLTVKGPLNVSGQKITSPLELSGFAPIDWGSDGEFAVRIFGDNDSLIADRVALFDADSIEKLSNSDLYEQDVKTYRTKGLPFTVTLEFEPQPSGAKGTIKIEKATPGLREDSIDSISIPVEF